jgi:hypothetical protein
MSATPIREGPEPRRTTRGRNHALPHLGAGASLGLGSPRVSPTLATLSPLGAPVAHAAPPEGTERGESASRNHRHRGDTAHPTAG